MINMTKQKAIEILNDEYNKNIVYRAVLSDKESDHINDVLIALLTAIDVLNQENVAGRKPTQSGCEF